MPRDFKRTHCRCLILGISLQTDFDETKVAAEQGDAVAQNNLGYMYDNGYGVPENDAEAVKWFRKAADQGLVDAQYNLGSMYGNGEGVPENDAEAIRLYRKAADQEYAKAQYNLGLMYDNGEGVPENNAEADCIEKLLIKSMQRLSTT